MNRIVSIASLLVLAAAVSARAQDQIDLHQVVIHDSPLDVADWPVTATITRLRETPGATGGLAFETQPTLPGAWQYQTFPQDHPQTGTVCAPQGGTDGCIQYTVWALAKIGGVWHGAGFMQMWLGRASTGAPLLANFHSDWAYACDRWAVLCGYQPQVGDPMAFFLTAGNARDYRDVTSVRERSNVVLLTVPAGDTADLSFPTAGGPPPSPPTPPSPDQPPAPVVDLTPRVQSLEAAVALLVNQLAGLHTAVVTRFDSDEARLAALEARKIPASCTARLFGTVAVSCSLNP